MILFEFVRFKNNISGLLIVFICQLRFEEKNEEVGKTKGLLPRPSLYYGISEQSRKRLETIELLCRSNLEKARTKGERDYHLVSAFGDYDYPMGTITSGSEYIRRAPENQDFRNFIQKTPRLTASELIFNESLHYFRKYGEPMSHPGALPKYFTEGGMKLTDKIRTYDGRTITVKDLFSLPDQEAKKVVETAGTNSIDASWYLHALMANGLEGYTFEVNGEKYDVHKLAEKVEKSLEELTEGYKKWIEHYGLNDKEIGFRSMHYRHNLAHGLSALAIYYGETGKTKKLKELVIDTVEQLKDSKDLIDIAHCLEVIGYAVKYVSLTKQQKKEVENAIQRVHDIMVAQKGDKETSTPSIGHLYNAIRLIKNS